MIGIHTSQWENLDGMGEEALAELRPEAEFRVKRAGLHFENALKVRLKGQRSGRTYRIQKRGRPPIFHQASAPGEAPATLYGNLSQSVGHSEPRWDGWTVETEVGVGLGTKPGGGEQDPETTYARRLEWGGIDSRGVRILPRPYLEPTSVAEDAAISAILEGTK